MVTIYALAFCVFGTCHIQDLHLERASDPLAECKRIVALQHPENGYYKCVRMEVPAWR